MLRLVFALIALLCAACPEDDNTSASGGPGCCKVCGNDAKPCGDSCIAREKDCHKVGGCACY